MPRDMTYPDALERQVPITRNTHILSQDDIDYAIARGRLIRSKTAHDLFGSTLNAFGLSYGLFGIAEPKPARQGC